MHLFSVFDGHGQFGTECSEFAKDTLALTLGCDPDLTKDPAKSFEKAFEVTNLLLHSSNVDDSMSGTTAVSVLVYGDKLFVANVGDSRAVMGIWNKERECVVAEDLSCDQTPFRKDECERVKKCGARVLSVDQVEGLKDPEVQSWGKEEEDEEGDPPRLWVEHALYPGTAFTRSVGDMMAEGIGVVAVPEVKEVKITDDCLFFVVASDGVFEFLSSQTVVNMVASFKDPRDACAAIAAESYKIWLEHENRTDDITIIIVHVKDMNEPDAPPNKEMDQISLTASKVISEKRRDFPNERSSSCVAPSPEKKLSIKTRLI